ncbi:MULTISPECIES: hypothetical protein [unclassified Methanoregula]|uniref:hypothetical protein n=1 Tax=unclassified Methanoregula TaxID=2649730 RepID=UPI0009CFB2C6|nr:MULTISPECIES: hypothetical protein [unclassified Methanoregula]OPX63990.1 MAG: hypothetical protein A4E33_01011 [Methanoregula sp. PtaB.Bin085]OPY33812.1 MAG: hypothetical protein A4E34_01752 [Methanoregula sp. PtaU1.Bin006]
MNILQSRGSGTRLLLWTCLAVAIIVAGCTTAPDQAYPSPASQEGYPPVGNATIAPLAWNSTPASPAGAALLEAANSLMDNIYTRAPDAPAYLPESYTNPEREATGYIPHTYHQNTVFWPADEQNQIHWISEPVYSSNGWEAVIQSAYTQQDVISPLHARVFTDCSGFITALFTRANTRTVTGFSGWKAGNTVPRAGCTNPFGGCTITSPINYYRFITSNSTGFRNIPLRELAAGDIISVTSTEPGQYVGHVMLVAAVSPEMDDHGSRIVSIIDVTDTPHRNDTRNPASGIAGGSIGNGIGMGYILLDTTPSGTVRSYRNLDVLQPYPGAVALGRAL